LGSPDDDAVVTVLLVCSLDDGDACLGVLFLVRRGAASYTSDSSRSTGFEAEVPIRSNSLRVGGGADAGGLTDQRVDTRRQLCQEVTGNSNVITRKRKYINYIAMLLNNIINDMRSNKSIEGIIKVVLQGLFHCSFNSAPWEMHISTHACKRHLSLYNSHNHTCYEGALSNSLRE
jgi:hypothetical protein